MISNEIRLSGILKESIVDGPGLRYVIFTQGCKKRCFMCHNESSLPLDGGEKYNLDDLVNDWKNPLLKGITISGGEPFLQADKCIYIAKKAKEKGLSVMIYSGYYYEELISMDDIYINELLGLIDILVDGPFEYENRSLLLTYRGSSNQRVILVKETVKKKEIVLFDEINEY